MNAPAPSVNAWIFLGEDEPSGANYNTPGSSYQQLITFGVYNYMTMVNICFVNTVPTSSTTVPAGDGSTYTIELQTATHPDNYTNQQYMDWVIRDARATNPNIKILATLGYAENEFTQIFSGPQSGWQQAADDYASNLVAYLQYYNLDGFDVDWEGSFSYATTPQQFAMLFTAIRAAFNAQSRYYYLTLSPADVGTLDATAVNNCCDFVNLQLYSGFTTAQQFIAAGVSKDLLAYGAKFEVNGSVPYQNAQNAYQQATAGGYDVITQWRLNSNDFQYEQAQQMILYQLVFGIPGNTFNDTPIIGAAGNPPITGMVVRHGDVLDAIQATNTGNFQGTAVQYQLLQHGGGGGTASTVAIAGGDAITEVSGYTGNWYGWNCVLQITLKTRNGVVFGPYGTMNNSSGQTAFSYTAPAGQSVVAFSGSTQNVPLAGGGNTDIIASLNVSFG